MIKKYKIKFLVTINLLWLILSPVILYSKNLYSDELNMEIVEKKDSFKSIKIKRTAEILLNDSKKKVFPLFGPIEEKKWAEEFDPIIISPEENPIKEGCVFLTPNANYQHTIWILTEYDEAKGRISYIRVTPERDVARIFIKINSVTERKSKAKVAYEYTALNEEGNKYISNHIKEVNYYKYIKEWERAINYYLKTGKQLPHH